MAYTLNQSDRIVNGFIRNNNFNGLNSFLKTSNYLDNANQDFLNTVLNPFLISNNTSLENFRKQQQELLNNFDRSSLNDASTTGKFNVVSSEPLTEPVTYGIAQLSNTPYSVWNGLTANDIDFDGTNIDGLDKTTIFNQIKTNADNGGTFITDNGQIKLLDKNGKLLNTFGKMNPSAMDKAAQGMSIFGSTMQGLNSLSQIGLGWANYAENRKMIKNLNDLTKEQIASSKEMRDQRGKEIERLNKARTYTKNAYGKGTTITRSVM